MRVIFETYLCVCIFLYSSVSPIKWRIGLGSVCLYCREISMHMSYSVCENGEKDWLLTFCTSLLSLFLCYFPLLLVFIFVGYNCLSVRWQINLSIYNLGLSLFLCLSFQFSTSELLECFPNSVSLK